MTEASKSPTQRVELDLTPDEVAVLAFLVNVDPNWGDPLKDIKDGTCDFARQTPYDALVALQQKLAVARNAAAKPTSPTETDDYDFQAIMDDRDARIEQGRKPCGQHPDGQHRYDLDHSVDGHTCRCGARRW